MSEMPLKIRSVRQHAQARSSMLFVSPRDRNRFKISPDDLGRRAGFLDLGNETDRAGASQGRSKVSRGRHAAAMFLELLKRLHSAGPLPLRSRFEPTISSRIVIRITHDIQTSQVSMLRAAMRSKQARCVRRESERGNEGDRRSMAQGEPLSEIPGETVFRTQFITIFGRSRFAKSARRVIGVAAKISSVCAPP